MTKICPDCDATVLSTSQPTTSELAPCPFCGACDAFAERDDFTSAYVTCNHCSARGPVECQESDDEETPGKSAAEISWNTRINRTSQPNRMGTTPKMQKMYDEFGGEPVAWRTKNDFGHWHVTQNRALAETWLNTEKFEVQPLFAALAATPAVGGEITAAMLNAAAIEWTSMCHGYPYSNEGVEWSEFFGRMFKAAVSAQPTSPLRGRDVLKHCDELHDLGFNAGWTGAIEAAALIVQPMPHVNEERRCEDIAAKIRAISASPPEQPASFAERNLIDRFGRHPKETK